jgi:rod shape determining protein RodA
MAESALTRPGQRERYDVKIFQVDWLFTLILTLIAGIGILILYSVGGMKWDPWAYRQLILYAVCYVVMIALAMVDLRWWMLVAYPFYGFSLFLLLLVPVIGDTRMGATRWLDFGFVSFQPADLMKIAIVLVLARWYHESSAKDANFSWKLIIPLGLIGAPAALVMHQPDLGTALLIAFTGLAVMVAAGLSRWIIVGGVAAAIPTAIFAYLFFLHDYQRDRINTLFNPESDPSGDGYHIIQSKIAIGSGGLLGKGLGLGSQSQLNFLPEKHTDFIMAAVCEELGLAGGFAIFALYGLAVFMALRMASVSHSHFGRLAACGVTATFSLYFLINGAMVMGLAPVVGVPMPLLSYGGTAMTMIMLGFGLVLGVKVHRYQELPRSASIFSRAL